MDPDQTPHHLACDLGLHCLSMSRLWDMRHKWVNTGFFFLQNSAKMSAPRKYTENAMQSALQEINQGSSSLRGASRKYGILLTSIYDRFTGKVTHPKWGKPTNLSEDKEKELINFAIKRTELGIGFTKQTFLRFAGKFAEHEGVRFSKGVATDKWWRGLKKRHPNFSLRSPEATSSGRHMAMTRLRLCKYFAALKLV